MRMEEQRIYTDAYISKSMNGNEWETDENGNPIVIIQASNENLDYQGERVLRSALMASKDYLLQNGVISFDHKHLSSEKIYEFDPKWNPEKYILGKPMEVWEAPNEDGIMTVFAKAVLSKSNSIAREIIGKLKDKIATVKASVGGRLAKKEMRLDTKTFTDVPTIVGVLWDEIALTYKPVNQTLGASSLSYPPVSFVKSLTAGNTANPEAMGTGGNTLQTQSLEGDAVRVLKEKFKGMSLEEIVGYLQLNGLSLGQSKKMAGVLINKSIIGGPSMADDNVTDDVNTVESSTDELLKALSELPDGDGEQLTKAMKKMKDGKYVFKGGYGYLLKADGSYEKMDDDAPDYKEEAEEEKNGGVEKSLGQEAPAMYDATEDVMELKKSVAVLQGQNKDMASVMKSMEDTINKQSAVLSAIGNQIISDSGMIKAIHDAPVPRTASVKDIRTAPRFEKSQVDRLANVTAGQLVKSMIDAGINPNTQAQANKAFRRGKMLQVVKEVPEVAALFVKEDA